MCAVGFDIHLGVRKVLLSPVSITQDTSACAGVIVRTDAPGVCRCLLHLPAETWTCHTMAAHRHRPEPCAWKTALKQGKLLRETGKDIPYRCAVSIFISPALGMLPSLCMGWDLIIPQLNRVGTEQSCSWSSQVLVCPFEEKDGAA